MAGVEALGMTELTIGKVLEQAALKVDETLIRHARYPAILGRAGRLRLNP